MPAAEILSYLVKPVQFYFENYTGCWSFGGVVGGFVGAGVSLPYVNCNKESYKDDPLGQIAESSICVFMSAVGGCFAGGAIMATLPVTLPVSAIYGLKLLKERKTKVEKVPSTNKTQVLGQRKKFMNIDKKSS